MKPHNVKGRRCDLNQKMHEAIFSESVQAQTWLIRGEHENHSSPSVQKRLQVAMETILTMVARMEKWKLPDAFVKWSWHIVSEIECISSFNRVVFFWTWKTSAALHCAALHSCSSSTSWTASSFLFVSEFTGGRETHFKGAYCHIRCVNAAQCWLCIIGCISQL